MTKVSITTFNCGKQFPFEDQHGLDIVIQELVPDGQNAQDIYGFGFQELTKIWEGSFEDTTVSYRKLLSSKIKQHLNDIFPNERYEVASTKNIGALFLILVVNERTFDINNILSNHCKCGYFGSNLKGSVFTCANLHNKRTSNNETFTFISCHLTANEGDVNLQYRINDINKIMSTCKRDLDVMDYQNGHIFFFGDLNFRVNSWLKTSVYNEDSISSLLNKNDELNMVRKEGLVLKEFTEGTISFPPTYKYTLSELNNYNDKRIPSWCDRILFKIYPKNLPPKIVSYNSKRRNTGLSFTDHEPVNLILEVPEVPSKKDFRNVTILSRVKTFEEMLGEAADYMFGYIGWLLYKKAHIWLILVIVLLFLLYKII
ncbi:hypothetical protein KAFR_0C01080 [Kazachstania africana CBS 2517]|uniref:Inositol polyphosphate-related phosphatase domain-containing protein n=1 Tax=Kazachstania africana (strain ATCC 22294 / BCRC 22015 / CBS 2517 / CECT 1963 / NBRC 1671 / NRRL Y-8276) TaxID=1071382 RepID=H2ARV3_KAZAF|nr:hypothetical protein KAFR_0C01080 [Kazachstania africana CBS 2517]CCF57103.1 hypothetical protein KAFR_0C01080 [Kazachstania africana CBS 2517]